MWHDVYSSREPSWGCRCCQVTSSHLRPSCPEGSDCASDGALNPKETRSGRKISYETVLTLAPAIELLGTIHTVFIKVKHGLCLEAIDRHSSGGKVHMKPCRPDGRGQVWLYDEANRQIRAGRDGECLDASQRTKHGGLVHIFECSTTNKNQVSARSPCLESCLPHMTSPLAGLGL